MIAVGATVAVDQRCGWPAGVITAWVERFEPYNGQGGYRLRWNYGRTPLQWESCGGWFSAGVVSLAPESGRE